MRKIYARIGVILFPLLLPFIRYILKRSSRVYVAITYQGQLLLIKNWLARDTWRFPGGGVGRKETEQVAAVREIKEELGIDIDIDALRHLSSGVLRSDSLGAKYSIYHYPLATMPLIMPSQLEIIDWRFFDEVPHEISADFSKTSKSLLKK